MKYVYYFLIPFLISLSTNIGYSFDEDLECSYSCQIKNFVQGINGSIPLDDESIILGNDRGTPYGLFFFDIAEHPVDDKMMYHKALIFTFDKNDQLIRSETLELDIFIENQATLDDFVNVANSFFLGRTGKLNFDGAIVAGKYLSQDQSFYKLEKGSTDFSPIIDTRNDNRQETKDCYTAWYGYYIGGVFRPLYIIAVWCTNNGNSGGGGTGGGSSGNWPKVCNKFRVVTWNSVVIGSYSARVSARLTKLSAGSWPTASVSIAPSGNNTHLGTVSLSVTGGYTGNGLVDAEARMTHSVNMGITTISTTYATKYVLIQFSGDCY